MIVFVLSMTTGLDQTLELEVTVSAWKLSTPDVSAYTSMSFCEPLLTYDARPIPIEVAFAFGTVATVLHDVHGMVVPGNVPLQEDSTFVLY